MIKTLLGGGRTEGAEVADFYADGAVIRSGRVPGTLLAV
jgi:hypothetical protein